MPVISRFYGISIFMYYEDHSPPHFHAKYGEFEASISIKNENITEGKLPNRAFKLVKEWLKNHKSEMLANWEYVSNNKNPISINPLN